MIVEGLHKLSVMMMCDLFDHFGLQNGYDTDLIRTAIATNHLWALEVAYPGLLDDFEIPEEAIFIDETVCLYKKLKFTYDSFTNAERDKLHVIIPNFSMKYDISFQGFNIISERNMVDISRIMKLLNYHEDVDLMKEALTAMTERYSAMLDILGTSCCENDTTEKFSLENFCKIILAGR